MMKKSPGRNQGLSKLLIRTVKKIVMGKCWKEFCFCYTTCYTSNPKTTKSATGADFVVLNVGKTGFEPATPWSQTRCATGLRYFPKLFFADTFLKRPLTIATLPISIGMRYRPALLPELIFLFLNQVSRLRRGYFPIFNCDAI